MYSVHWKPGKRQWPQKKDWKSCYIENQKKEWRQNLVTLKTRQTDCLDSVSRLPIFRPLFSCSWHDHWLTCIFYLWNEYAEHACVCWPRWIFSSYFSLTKMVVSMALEVGVRYCVYFQKWENNDMNRKYIGSARIVLCSHISSSPKANPVSSRKRRINVRQNQGSRINVRPNPHRFIVKSANGTSFTCRSVIGIPWLNTAKDFHPILIVYFVETVVSKI